jgi:hypothetical protein
MAYKTNDNIEKISWHTTTGGRSMNSAEVVFGNSHVHIVGRNAPDTMADHSKSGTMNIFSLSNIRTQI